MAREDGKMARKHGKNTASAQYYGAITTQSASSIKLNLSHYPDNFVCLTKVSFSAKDGDEEQCNEADQHGSVQQHAEPLLMRRRSFSVRIACAARQCKRKRQREM